MTDLRTFGDLDGQGLELEVTCQKCGYLQRFHSDSVDRQKKPLRDRVITGQRFVCECGGIGLPTLRRRWVESLSRHGQALEARNRRS